MREIVVLVSYTAQPGRADEARQEIVALVATVLAREPECLGISILQDADDPCRLTLVERWPDRDLFVGPHLRQPHLQAFIARASAFLAGPPQLSFWHPVPAA